MIYFGLFILIQVQDPWKELSDWKVLPDQVSWNSETHQHIYHDPRLYRLVAEAIDVLDKSPEETLKNLSLDEKKHLAQDSLSSRDDLLDLLSIELKLRLQGQWRRKISKIPYYDPSELWSLAKFRIKKLLDPSANLSTGVSLFREFYPQDSRATLACGFPHASLMRGKISLESQNAFEFAGVSLRSYDFQANSTYDWSCGSRRFKILGEKNASDIQFLSDIDYEPMKKDGKFLIWSSLSLVDKVSQNTIDDLRKYFEWVYGWKFVKQESIHFQNELKRALKEVDFWIPLLDAPHANQINISLNQSEGTRLVFKKSKIGIPIEFEIWLPPSRQAHEDQGVFMTIKEIETIWKPRESTPLILDSSCFSSKYFGNWLLAASQTSQVQPIILSNSGHSGEDFWQVLEQLDHLLEAVEAFTDQSNLNTVLARLQNGGSLSKLLKTWNYIKYKMGKAEAESLASLYPMVHLPIQAKWNDLQTIRMTELGKSPRLYPSKFAFSNDERP